MMAGLRILLTGGFGFLGQEVFSLLSYKHYEVMRFRKSEFDITKEEDVVRLYERFDPDIVVHMAAQVGGIGINRQKPGTFYYNNLMMGTLMMEHARRNGIRQFVSIGTICAYPKYTPVPFKEEDLWDGYPEETNAAYGLAKKMLLVQSQAYRQEYGLEYTYLMPVNLYGPRDNFDPESSHVIPALIKKFIDAKESGASEVEIWGTGSATREFLYVKDAARAIENAIKYYNSAKPLNIGTGQEVSIKDLASMISSLCGYEGSIRWNDNYPDGQPRRCLDVSRALDEIYFKASTTLEEGLRETIEWYKRERAKCEK